MTTTNRPRITWTVVERAELADGTRALCRVTYTMADGFAEPRAIKIEAL